MVITINVPVSIRINLFFSSYLKVYPLFFCTSFCRVLMPFFVISARQNHFCSSEGIQTSICIIRRVGIDISNSAILNLKFSGYHVTTLPFLYSIRDSLSIVCSIGTYVLTSSAIFWWYCIGSTVAFPCSSPATLFTVSCVRGTSVCGTAIRLSPHQILFFLFFQGCFTASHAGKVTQNFSEKSCWLWVLYIFLHFSHAGTLSFIPGWYL